MAAAEKFKAPEQPTVVGETPSATVQPLHESDEEEVTNRRYTRSLWMADWMNESTVNTGAMQWSGLPKFCPNKTPLLVWASQTFDGKLRPNG